MTRIGYAEIWADGSGALGSGHRRVLVLAENRTWTQLLDPFSLNFAKVPSATFARGAPKDMAGVVLIERLELDDRARRQMRNRLKARMRFPTLVGRNKKRIRAVLRSLANGARP